MELMTQRMHTVSHYFHDPSIFLGSADQCILSNVSLSWKLQGNDYIGEPVFQHKNSLLIAVAVLQYNESEKTHAE